jgi:TRAP-type C4-dicarboxylate transport system permease small subunit
MRRTLDLFYDGLMALAAVALVAAFVCVVAGVADRQFGLGLRGLDAYAGYAIAAALFLALPGTLQRGEHIRVTLLLQRAPASLKAVLEWFCLVAGVLLTAGLAWYAARGVWVSYTTHDVSQGSDATPLWIPQVGMALGCIGLAVAMLDAAVSRLVGSRFERQGAEAELAQVER